MLTNALLLAGGLGTRLRPLTDRVPKCLVPIGKRALLDYWIASLSSVGVAEAVINTHHLAPQVEQKVAQIKASARLRLRAQYEPQLLGSAGTIANNRELAAEASEVIVVYADNLSDVPLGQLLAFHRSHKMGLTMVLFHTDTPEACGIAALSSDRTVVEFVEKPALPKSTLANAGVYVLDADTYRQIADWRAFDLARDVLPSFVGRMKGYVHLGYHRDIGTHEALSQARRDIRQLNLWGA